MFAIFSYLEISCSRYALLYEIPNKHVFLSVCLSFQPESKGVNKRLVKNHFNFSKSIVWELLSNFMCKSHPGQSPDQGTKINKTNTFVLKKNNKQTIRLVINILNLTIFLSRLESTFRMYYSIYILLYINICFKFQRLLFKLYVKCIRNFKSWSKNVKVQ